MTSTTASWRDEFVLARDFRSIGRQSELLSRVRSGELLPVTRGAYRYAAALTRDEQASGDDTYLATIRAVHLLAAEPLVFSGLAAAAVWQLPVVAPWPSTVSVVTDVAAGGRSNVTIARTSVGHPAPRMDVDGLTVTTLARTVIDVGRTADFAQGVTVADAALRGQEKRATRFRRLPVALEEVQAELLLFGSLPGVSRCRGVIDFADGGSGSPGESISRVHIQHSGFPPPELQATFFDRRGFIGTVDFWWPEFRLIGEFDGKGKYLRAEFARGRSVAQIVMDEKDRENRLRALGNNVTRWGWSTALSGLRAHLIAAGLPITR